MSKKIKLFLNDELLNCECHLANSFFDRFLGLMFSKKPDSQKILVFKNTPWIHSFFVFFKFDTIFLDNDFRVIAYKNNIPPFSILKPVLKSLYSVEIVNRCFEIKLGDKIYIDEY